MLPHLKPLRKNSQSIKHQNVGQSSFEIADSVKMLVGAMTQFMRQIRNMNEKNDRVGNVGKIQNLIAEQIQHSKNQNRLLERFITEGKISNNTIDKAWHQDNKINDINEQNNDQKGININQNPINISKKDINLQIFTKYETENKLKQVRFQYIDYPITQDTFNQSQQQQRQKQIIDWIGSMLKQVLSVGFNLFKSGELQQNKVKPFCSENILRNLISLSHRIKLTKQQMQAINKSLVQQFIPYFVVKYPQTQQIDTNSRFSKMLIQRDLIDDNQYDFVYKSGIKFAYDANKNYNSQIMQFFNYILQLPSNPVVSKMNSDGILNKQQIQMVKRLKSNEEIVGQRQKKENQLKQNQQQKQKYKEKQKEKQKEGLLTENKVSIRKCFFQQMQTLFKMVQSEQNLILMQKFDPHYPQSKPNNEKLNEIKKSQSEQLQYREKVKSYTSFQIGQKLSEGTTLFKQYEINSGNLKLRSSALMRVATKWCEQLQKCFDQNSIINRESPFRMKDGQQKYLQKNKVGYLNYLLQKQKKQIDEIMIQITNNNNYHQAQQMNAELNRNLRKFTIDEAIIGQFCTSIFKNNLNYLINYLNLLIHGINKACIEFEKLQWCLADQQNYDVYGTEFKQLKSLEVDNTEQRWSYIQSKTIQIISKDLTDKSMPSEVPELITFRIGDLLRCKCSSKQNQIIALYQQVQKRSKQNPDQFKIIRVKNRLKRGNKDILMNILYKNTMIVEMQLAIKQEKSKFVEYSNKFNHYLYELKRAKFGPIMEMCSIWMSQDLRAKFYLDKLERISKRKKFTEKQKQTISRSLADCCEKHSKVTTLPFICDKCKFFYAEYGLDEKHMKCTKCHTFTCFLCQFQAGKLQQKLKTLPQFKQNQNFSIEELEFIEHVPQIGGLVINLNSRDKKALTFYTTKHHNNYYIFEYIESSDKIKLIEEFTSKKIPQSFLKQNVICSSKAIKKKLKTNSNLVSDLIKKYFVGSYLKQNNKSQKISFSMINQKISQDTLETNNVKYLPSVRKLNLSQNMGINSLEPLINKFPNVQLAVLNRMSLVQIPQNLWTRITQLYLRNNKLKSLKGLVKCVNLIELEVSTNQIEQITDQIENSNKIQKLFIDNNKLKYISSKIGELTGLKMLNLSSNKELSQIPNIFEKTKSMKVFEFSQLTALNKIPNSFKNLTLIQTLVFKKLDKVQRFPEQLTKLNRLKVLEVSENPNLKQFGFDIAGLTQLQILIIFQNKSLQNLPNNIVALQKLKQLHIQQNKSIKQVPLANSKLHQLKILQIKANHAVKSITQPLVNFDKLQILRIHSSVIAHLPQTIGNLSNLIQFQLKWNNEIVKLPQSIGELKKMKKMVLILNKKLKQLPKSLGKLNELQELKVQNSESIIPMYEQFKTMQSLKIIKIKGTNLKQFDPQLFNSLNFLQKLTIQQNQQLELLPQTMGNLKSLKQLIVDYNQKLKMLPESLSQITTLQILSINQNPCIELPKSFTQIKKLKNLRILYNKQLKLPNQFQKFQQLKILCLNNNHWYETLPSSICQIKSLQQMSIENNSMLKQLPQNFGHLDQLIQLNLYMNLVTTLPESFGNLKSLTKLKLSSCMKFQKLPQSFGNLRSLKQLKLHSLKAMTQLPQNFGSLSALQQLTISSNTQLLSLPASIGNLKQLKIFFFEYNHCVIQLPQSISNLKKLKVLKLNNNSSLRKIPADMIRITSLQRLETNMQQQAIPTTIRHLMTKQFS